MRHYLAVVVSGVCTADGRPIVYSSGDDDLHNSPFRDVNSFALRAGAIQSISAFSAAIEDGASSATSGVTTLSLHADDLSLIGYRPIDIFARVGAESLTASQVWATAGITAGGTTLQLSSGTAQTLTTTFLHVGVEAVRPRSTSIPSIGGVTITRGQAYTLPLPHRADLSGFLARTIPVTTVPTEWIGRRVLIFVDGQLWRVLILTDNPHVDAQFVSLSMIDAVNVLSVQKKSCQVPAYATSLATQTISLTFDPIFSCPDFAIPVKRADAMVTTPGTWGTNGAFTGGTLYTRRRILYSLGEWWQHSNGWTVRNGALGIPPLTLRLIADPTAVEQETRYELPMSGGGGSATTTISSTCNLGPAAPTPDLDQFLAESSSRNFYLRRAEIGPRTFWAKAGLSYLNSSSDFASVGIWNSGSGFFSPWSVSMKPSGRLALISRFSIQAGWPNMGVISRPFYVGLVHRRNVTAEEDAGELQTATRLVDGLYSDWSETNQVNATTDGPINTVFGGADPDWTHTFYAVRPVEKGAVHNVVVTERGVVCSLDAWDWDRTRVSGSLEIDYCEPGLWWEPGIATIKTNALIPLTGTTGEVEIRWQEPSGEWLRALGTVTYSSVSSGIYTYSIGQDVTMLDGSPCVGFGTWHGFAPCQITPPTFVRTGMLGWILAKIIASTDSTSGRLGDELGDGFALPLTNAALLSFCSVMLPGLTANAKFAADEDFSYNDFIETACRVSGLSVVGRLADPADLVAGYCPHGVLMGRPMSHEEVARWTDDDLIGIPQTTDGFAGPIYTSYSITCGSRHWQINDWLAGDILGQGDELELDLTPIIARRKSVTDEVIEALVDRLRDRFGTIRRRWVLRVPIERTLSLGVGDVVAVTSEYLLDPGGGLGVSDRLARILSLTHDFTAGVSDVELIAYAAYGAGWSASYDVFVSSVSGSSYTLTLRGATTPTTVADVRREEDLANWAPQLSSSVYYYLIYTQGPTAGGVKRGYLTAWNAATHTATFYQTSTYANPSGGTGWDAVLIPSTIPVSQADLFQLGRDRLL